ncbi:MAG: DUF362 domain-containing protein [Anaerolineae bacterium]
MIEKDFFGKGKVAVLRTSPATVLEDYGRLMRMVGYQHNLPKDNDTLLKINISWQIWYPGCSTPPWQLEGVIKTLLEDGYRPESLIAAHNRTVVVSAREGEINNRQKVVVEKYGIENLHIYEPHVEWVTYEPKEPFLVLDQIYPEGVRIPKTFIGKNIIQLPQTKTHVFTTMTGAMKNAFGGLLGEKRHWTHSVIHETLVDLLTIQQDIHSGLFAVMDGTLAGDGPGPRAMRPHVKNVLLASADQVAIDAMAAKMMGFDPLSLKFIRLAHEKGLGVGDPRQIEIVGDLDAAAENWHFSGAEDTFASRGQKMIYHGLLKPFEKLLLRTPLVPWSYLASNVYHNVFWYPFVGKQRVERILGTDWGRLFLSYGDGGVNPGYGSRVPFVGLTVGATALAVGFLWFLARTFR